MARLRERAILALAVVVLVVFVAYPLARIILQSFTSAEGLTLANYVKALRRQGALTALRHTLEVGLLATLGATVLGTFLGWLVGRTDLWGRSFFRTAFVLPFITPPFIGAFAWRQLLGPVGYLNKAYMALSGSAEPLWNFYGLDGIVAVMTLHLYPLVYITTLGALERMNPELEEAAQACGAPVFRVMRDVTLPLVMPSILSGATLVFIAAIANFGIPAILGFPANYYVLTTRIWEAVSTSSNPDSLAIAAALSVILGVAAACGLLAQRLLLRRREYTVISGKSMHPNLVLLGPHRFWLAGVASVLVVVTSAAPIAAILLTSLTPALGIPPLPANWTLANFRHVLVVNRTVRRAIGNSLILAVSAATIVSALGAAVSYITVKTRVRGRAIVDVVANMPYALPGTVVGVAMILAWLRPIPALGFSLYNTLWIILVAYVARYLAFGVRTTTASLHQVHESLEEASRVSGATWSRTFVRIVVPLILPGLAAGWFLVFMPTLRELTISILLWSTRHETIGVMVFNLQESGNTVAAAALAVVMMAVLLVANVATRRLTRGRLGF